MSRRALGIAVALAVAGCGASERQPQHPIGPAGPGLVPVVTPAGDAVSFATTTTVTPAGRAFSAPDAGLAVSIPPSALGTTTDLAVTPIVNMARGAIGPAYRLGPEGTTFAVPVTLTFKAPGSYPIGTSLDQVGVEYRDAAGYWHRVSPVSRDAAAGTVSVQTTHFSDWAVTWQGGTPVAEGPISLVQTYVGPGGVPFTASGSGTIHFLSDDAADTSYGLTGTLTVQDAIIRVGAATCVPAPATVTLPLNVAEAHKSVPPVFRWGIGARWSLACSDGSTVVMPALFDTMSINLTRCAGSYAPGQVVASDRLAGSFATDCGADGSVTGTWDLRSCWDGRTCSTGVECRDGITQCTAGVQTCVDAGPSLDATACGTTGWTCLGGVCTAP